MEYNLSTCYNPILFQVRGDNDKSTGKISAKTTKNLNITVLASTNAYDQLVVNTLKSPHIWNNL